MREHWRPSKVPGRVALGVGGLYGVSGGEVEQSASPGGLEIDEGISSRTMCPEGDSYRFITLCLGVVVRATE